MTRCALNWLAFSLLFVSSSLGADGVWPQWRGPASDGHCTESNVPTQWDAKSIVWKCPLPGDGQSSPVISGGRIFLTSALSSGAERVVLCVDRQSGKIVWQEVVWKGEPEKSHNMNGWASATCATDGKHVVAFFGRGGLHGFTVEGKKLWSRDLGEFAGPWGTGASPVIVGKTVVQNLEAEQDASIAAFDLETGKTVWQTPRDVPQRGGWSSPVLTHGEKAELVLNGFNGVTGYDPTSGKKLWFCKSFAGRGEPTALPGEGIVYMLNGLQGDFYAVRTGGSGEVTGSHMAWHTPRKAGRDQPSPIVVGGIITVVSMDGVGVGYDAKSGRELWKDRLGGKFTSSPIAANGLVYFQSDSGETVVIKPDDKLNVVARNQLPTGGDEIFRASLSPSLGQIFSRSNRVLYCLSETSK